MVVDAIVVDACIQDVLGWPPNRKWSSKDKDERIRSFFGASIVVLVDLWGRLGEQGLEGGARLKHMLWALTSLKVYASTEVLCAIVGWPSRKTFSKWAWYFVERIAGLKNLLIRLENRFDGLGHTVGTNVSISVDCTDCPVHEPRPFDKKMFSHKFNGPGLKYGVAVCIKTGLIVWTNGPFEASVDDPTISKDTLSGELFDDEAVEVDKGYKGDDKFMKKRKTRTTSKSRFCRRAKKVFSQENWIKNLVDGAHQ